MDETSGNPYNRPMDRTDPRSFARRFVDRSRQLVLAEVQPTPSQLQRGLELHADATVIDVYCGNAFTNARAWFYTGPMLRWALDHMDPSLDEADRRQRANEIRDALTSWRALEYTAETQMQEAFRIAVDAAGVDLASDNVMPKTFSGRDSAPAPARFWYEAVKAVARASCLYDRLPVIEKLTDLSQLPEIRTRGNLAVHWHFADTHMIYDVAADDPAAQAADGFALADPVENLNLFYGMGFRLAQLVNGGHGVVGSGHYAEGDRGLTDLGRAVVARMNELGMVIDLSHSGSRTILDIIAASEEPVIGTHFGCRSVTVSGKSPSRNITDEAMKAVADRGGLVGVTVAPNLVGGYEVDNFHRHLQHAVNVIGADHVCIGTDEGALGPATEPDELIAYETPSSFAEERRTGDGLLQIKDTARYLSYTREPQAMGWTNWPYWATVAMVTRGFAEADIRKIIGENYLRVAGAITDKTPRGPLI